MTREEWELEGFRAETVGMGDGVVYRIKYYGLTIKGSGFALYLDPRQTAELLQTLIEWRDKRDDWKRRDVA